MTSSLFKGASVRASCSMIVRLMITVVTMPFSTDTSACTSMVMGMFAFFSATTTVTVTAALPLST